mmetsp:Transcript_30285/g.54937  ORF Transcript_30285/g.54937 Transcript_30285/m.54937 type:complete len:173 (-) Transcript_30285:65-583(-)
MSSGYPCSTSPSELDSEGLNENFFLRMASWPGAVNPTKKLYRPPPAPKRKPSADLHIVPPLELGSTLQAEKRVHKASKDSASSTTDGEPDDCIFDFSENSDQPDDLPELDLDNFDLGAAMDKSELVYERELPGCLASCPGELPEVLSPLLLSAFETMTANRSNGLPFRQATV